MFKSVHDKLVTAPIVTMTTRLSKTVDARTAIQSGASITVRGTTGARLPAANPRLQHAGHEGQPRQGTIQGHRTNADGMQACIAPVGVFGESWNGYDHPHRAHVAR